MKPSSKHAALALAFLAACGPDLASSTTGDDQTVGNEAELSAALVLTPSTLNLASGSTGTVSLSVNKSSSFAIDAPVVGAGLSASLSSSTVTKGHPVTLTLRADASASGSSSFSVSVHSSSSTLVAKGTVVVSSAATGGGTGSGGGTATGGGGGTSTGVVRVLFDAAHNQVAGNADWVLDSHFPLPQPTVPTSETSWSGGISAWGYRLVASGNYSVAQLAPGTALNWGQGGTGDLANFDVFISDEPELPFSSNEQAALMQFAHAGKGLFFASDHSGAKRCGGCTEAWQVINGFLVGGAAAGTFGVKVDGTSGSPAGTAIDARVTTGPFGQGTQMHFNSGSTVSLTSGNSKAALLVTSGSSGLMAGSELSSGGRLVVLGDSSPIEDGTCQCSAKLHNGWGSADHATLVLNATAWLAHQH